MNYARTLKFADTQARLRAKIGKLPDTRTWQVLALHPAGDLMEGLEGVGVDFWLEGLSPAVSAAGLERHFDGRVRVLFRRVAGWLPREWDEFGAHLMLAPDIFWVAPVLDGYDPLMHLAPGSMLEPAARAAPDRRRSLVDQTPLARFLEGDQPPEAQWRNALAASVPRRLPTAEMRPVGRLLGTLEEHLEEKSAELERLAAAPQETAAPGVTGPGTWQRHRLLERQLYTQLAGDPFHPALILIYLLLELLTMEKLRALLLGRLLGWPLPAALTGEA